MSLRSQRFSASFALKSYLTQRTQKIRREPLRSIFHSKNRVAVALVTDLVDFFFASIATIEPVRTVDHDAVHFTDVLIPMNNSRRYQHRRGIVRTNNKRRHTPKRFRVLTIVPESQLEVRRSKKTKKVSLVDVFVRPARDPRSCCRDIRHHRKKLFIQTVVTEKLSQPAARIERFCQPINDYSLDLAVSKAVGHWQLPLRVRSTFCSHRFQRPCSRLATNSQTFPHQSTSLRALPTSSHRARCKRC